MRTSLLFLLLASAAMPALAADEEADRAARREARAEARAERQAERAPQVERSESRPQGPSIERRSEERIVIRQQQPEVIRERVLERRIERSTGEGSDRPALEQRIVRSEQSLGAEPRRHTMEQRREAIDSVREWRGRQRQVDGGTAAIEPQGDAADRVRQWRGRERRVGNIPAEIEQHNGTLNNGSFRELRREPSGRDSIGNRRGPVSSSIPQQGVQPPLPTSTRRATGTRLSSVTAQHWRNHWRSDHRYDWRNHRRHHRSLFHFGFYYDPFGWSYRPYSIGSRLWPSYYRSSYWLNDPWQYRLPYAPPGYRWIRYYDDAVLVDTWDGQVVDVIYNFFW